MWFDSLDQVVRVVVSGVVAYVALVAVLRISGKRTLGKLNAFDVVVSVALGSLLASSIVSGDVAIVEAVVAFAVLAGAQYVVAFVSVRARPVRRFVKSGPALLVHDGTPRPEVLRRERVTEGEVRQALRNSGLGGMEMVAAVVLETDGTLSVIPRSSLGSGDSLADVGHALPSGTDDRLVDASTSSR